MTRERLEELRRHYTGAKGETLTVHKDVYFEMLQAIDGEMTRADAADRAAKSALDKAEKVQAILDNMQQGTAHQPAQQPEDASGDGADA